MAHDDFVLRQTRAGIAAEVSAGPARGHVVTLFVHGAHTREQIEDAKRQLRRELDVVMVQIIRKD